jgi:uncharacterized protein with HEPN domain
MQRDRVLIEEMITAAEQAMEILGDRVGDELAVDRLRRDALLWNMTVLGEAATHVSEATKAANPDVEWRPPAQLRNRLVHGYWEVDLDIVAATVRRDLPALVSHLRAVQVALDA